MIELDQTDTYYISEFGRFKNPPTHAELVLFRWSLPVQKLDHRDRGFETMLRPHIEAAYVYGRLDNDGAFTQTDDDLRLLPVQAGMDMTEYRDLEPRLGDARPDGTRPVLDTPDALVLKEARKKALAIKAAVLSPGVGPHPADPTQQRARPGKRRHRPDEEDLDIVFSHTDWRLRGKAI